MNTTTPSPYRAIIARMGTLVRPFGLRLVIRKGRPQRFERVDGATSDTEGAWAMLRAYARQLRQSDDLRCYSDTVEIAARVLAGPTTYPRTAALPG